MKNGGFILGGRTATSLGIVMTSESKRPILPSTQDSVITVLGRNGAYDYGAKLNSRSLDLECAMITKDYIELQQKVSELASFLTDHDGKPKTMRLILDYQPDRYYNVRLSGSLPINRIFGLGRFTLPLVAFEPYAHALEEGIHSEVITDGYYSFNVESKGTVVTPTVIELTNLGANTLNGFTIEIEFFTEV